jgi:hypothetical protein
MVTITPARFSWWDFKDNVHRFPNPLATYNGTIPFSCRRFVVQYLVLDKQADNKGYIILRIFL